MIELLKPDEMPEALVIRCPMEAAYIRQFAQVPSKELIRNVETDVRGLVVGDALMPVTIDSPHPGNCYVVSPSSAYTDYAEYELQILPQPLVKSTLRAVIAGFQRWCRRVRLDRIVHINNWMLSTNLYSDWNGERLHEITAIITERFPDKAVAFRSLNTFSNGEMLQRAVQSHYLLLPSRQVYIQDARQGKDRQFSERRDFKHDRKLFARGGYRVCAPDPDRDPEVFARIEDLYGKLYLEKYTPLNPQFTRRWLRNGYEDRWLNLLCLVSPEGSIDGVSGFLRRGTTMTTPVLGYDTALPQSLGLYRMLSWICTDFAIQNGLTFNNSAGAASFKRSRGASAHIEYSAVYVRHLDPEQRLAWRVLSGLLNRFAAPLLQRYAL